MGARGQPALKPAELAQMVRPVTLAHDHHVPVVDALRPLLPGGALRRGSTVEVGGSVGATSLAVGLAAEATATGSWAAVVGMRSLGLVAASELGVDLRRLVLVAEPPPREWPTVVGMLLDAFDIVIASPVRVRAADARRLTAKLREQGPCLVLAPDARSAIDGRRLAVTSPSLTSPSLTSPSLTSTGWGQPPDLALWVHEARWTGLGYGHGNLRARRVTVTAEGRRRAGRQVRADLWLPGPQGGIHHAEDARAAPEPTVLHRAG